MVPILHQVIRENQLQVCQEPAEEKTGQFPDLPGQSHTATFTTDMPHLSKIIQSHIHTHTEEEGADHNKEVVATCQAL